MPAPPSIDEVADQLRSSILATPRRQRRLKSRTLWSLFGFKVRSADRVTAVSSALDARNILVTTGDGTALGVEDRDSWLVLSYLDPTPAPAPEPEPSPPPEWFDLVERRVFESEREVEYYFVIPLFERLGYGEDDFAVGHPVTIYEGVRRVRAQADCVLFDGVERSPDRALVVVEAKRAGRTLADDAAGQARAYAMWLATPFYVVTNGDRLRVYLFRGAVQSDVLLLDVERFELRERWQELARLVGRSAVVEHKRRVSDRTTIPPSTS